MILENDGVILENDFVGKMTMAWNYNLSWCPRKKEADSIPRRNESTLATDCTPPSFIKKYKPQQTGNNHRALMGRSSAAAVQ